MRLTYRVAVNPGKAT